LPRTRQSREIWENTRRIIWERDKGLCQRCGIPLALEVCHIDHIKSGKLAGNEHSNLRVLCRRCHVLRLDQRHRGMIAKALADGIIPYNWRELLWDG
jgi:5-methylcytosine-specific restriction endonuclease McrA